MPAKKPEMPPPSARLAAFSKMADGGSATAAAAAEPGALRGATVATLRYGARAVQQLGNGNVRYIF